jgi:hypothetical protein
MEGIMAFFRRTIKYEGKAITVRSRLFRVRLEMDFSYSDIDEKKQIKYLAHIYNVSAYSYRSAAKKAVNIFLSDENAVIFEMSNLEIRDIELLGIDRFDGNMRNKFEKTIDDQLADRFPKEYKISFMD